MRFAPNPKQTENNDKLVPLSFWRIANGGGGGSWYQKAWNSISNFWNSEFDSPGTRGITSAALGTDFETYKPTFGDVIVSSLAQMGKGYSLNADIMSRAGGYTVSRAVTSTKKTAITPFYPKNNGFLKKESNEYLMPGDKISRYGSENGKYFSPTNTPLMMRALPPNTNIEFFSTYKVLKPFMVKSGTIAPAFGKMGYGKQYLSPVSAKVLLKKKIIEKN